MPTFSVALHITIRDNMLNPQDKVILDTMHHQLDFNLATSVKLGKYLLIELEAADENEVRSKAEQIMKSSIINPVTDVVRIGEIKRL